MFLFLSKVLPPLVLPMGLGLLLLLGCGIALLRRRRGAALALLVLALLVLWPLSTPVVADALLASLEGRYPVRLASAVPAADAVVILGGGTTAGEGGHLEIELGGSAERILYGMRLYRSGRAPYLILSGGTFVPGDTEAEEMRAILTEWGVPAGALVLENASRNTHENAVGTLALARARGVRRLILVTSAFHMPRAAAIFRKEAWGSGIEIIPAPTGCYVGGQRPYAPMDYLPDASALGNSTVALREFIGLLVYRARGWL